MTTSVQYYGTGRRKSATARVFLRKGKGRILINKRTVEDYFPREVLRQEMLRPLADVELADEFDAFITVKGGGNSGQAGAVRLGISRALLEINPEYRAILKPKGYLTRDARKVERKKYGQKGARAHFQFSKR
jgi:small subunit ribosomal protein S9